jgi:shikimate dehydrogenase
MTDRYAVVGNPIAQSKSPIIHALFAKQTNQDLTYERIEAPLEGFAATIDRLRSEGFRGVNITAPFKLNAFDYANDRSQRAQQAGAANAMRFDGDIAAAENFDGVGLVRDIEANLQFEIKDKRVLILGAGGATRGALSPILAARAVSVTLTNRDVDKAAQLVADVAPRAPIRVCHYSNLQDESFDLILNATSSSLFADCPDVPAAAFRRCSLAYDLTYGKGMTPFLALANKSGAASVADGVGMLVEQAAEAFYWWRGVRPDTREAIETIGVPLV